MQRATNRELEEFQTMW